MFLENIYSRNQLQQHIVVVPKTHHQTGHVRMEPLQVHPQSYTIQTQPESEFNHQHVIRLHQLEQPHYAVTGLIVLAIIVKAPALIMVV